MKYREIESRIINLLNVNKVAQAWGQTQAWAQAHAATLAAQAAKG